MLDDDSGVVDLGDEGLKTGIPLKSAPDAWLINVFNGLTRMDYIIQTLQGYTDARVYLYVRNLIIKIPEDKIRIGMLKALDEEIARIDALPVGPNLTNEDKGRLRIIACQNAAGGVVGYFDEYVGISRTLVIGKI